MSVGLTVLVIWQVNPKKQLVAEFLGDYESMEHYVAQKESYKRGNW